MIGIELAAIILAYLAVGFVGTMLVLRFKLTRQFLIGGSPVGPFELNMGTILWPFFAIVLAGTAAAYPLAKGISILMPAYNSAYNSALNWINKKPAKQKDIRA